MWYVHRILVFYDNTVIYILMQVVKQIGYTNSIQVFQQEAQSFVLLSYNK